MKNYFNTISGKNTPQTAPLPFRIDQVKNNAGGYVFQITEQEQLERFLLLGSEGGTYYVGEDKLTLDNAKSIIGFIKKDASAVAKTAITFLASSRAPKTDPALFVLALVATYGDAAGKKLVYDSVSEVCKTSTHLFTFVANVNNLRGWSRGLRRAVARFYETKKDDKLVYQVLKYRNRAGFTHADVIRLSHPKMGDNDIIKYVLGKTTEAKSTHQQIVAFEAVQKIEESKKIVPYIIEGRLTWEMIPTQHLNAPEVLSALVDNMPLTALIRNLNRFAKAPFTLPEAREVNAKILAKLNNAELISKSGIHPVNVINYMKTYASGRGFLSKSEPWTANQRIVDALSDMYEKSLTNVESTNKQILIATDVSSSMSSNVSKTSMSAGQLANVLALTFLKTEPNAELIHFDTKGYLPLFGKRNSVDEAIAKTPNGGGTDCSIPFGVALKSRTKYDAFVILTDNETWAGAQHGTILLEKYKKEINPDVKVVEIALVSNPYSTLPQDKNLLRIVGFDASVLDLLNEFLR